MRVMNSVLAKSTEPRKKFLAQDRHSVRPQNQSIIHFMVKYLNDQNRQIQS